MIKVLKKIKDIATATSQTNIRYFKIRNRFLLLFALLFIVFLLTDNNDKDNLNNKKNIEIKDKNSSKYQELDNKYKYNEIISNSIYDNKDNKDNKEKQEQDKQEQNKKEVSKNRYKIMIIAFSNEELANRYKESIKDLDIKIERDSNLWLAYIGPYYGYSIAKKRLNELTTKYINILPKDIYIKKDR